MPEGILRIYQQISEVVKNLTLRQRIIIISSGTILIIGLIILILLAGRENYSPLYTNLNSEDAAAIVNKLKELNVPYKLQDAGTTVSVPSEQVYELRLQLASAGLPQGGGVGFEIFDRTSYTITEMVQKVNYRRALEGELARTISGFDQIERAKVHLAIPSPELYVEEEKEPTASVVLKLKPGKNLTEEQVKGIMHLVAHSVEGLKMENVDVIDFKGNVLSETVTLGKPLAERKLTLTQIEAERNYETNLKKEIQSMLEKIVGPDKAVARVRVSLNFDERKIESETYQPVVGKEGIIRSEQSTRENFEGTGNLPGGVPGVESNVPGYQQTSPTSGKYKREEETKNYEINKAVEQRVVAPGKIERISVAVVVDSKELTPERIEEIRRAVIAAGGLDLKRGDQISVESMPFSPGILEAREKEEKEYLRYRLYLLLAGIILTLSLVVLLYFSLRPQKVKVEEFLPVEPVPIEKLEEKIPEKIPPEEIPPEELSPEELERRRKIQIREEIENWVRQKPQEIANIIRGWILEE
jgi:flagellar M-ring protein FliF